MSRAGKITRRVFLVSSAVIAGGVAFGYWAVKRPHANPLLEDLKAGEASFNPFVKISEQGITLITPHADIGQGVMHVQAALIAEEMDLAFGQFETDFGQPSPAYYNTAMGGEAAPVLSSDDSFKAEAMRGFFGSVFKLIGMQGTGGSSSVPDSFDKLRQAGAVARETLKAAAAQQQGLDRADLQTEAGHVILPDGEKIPYTALASVAASIEPITEVSLRAPSEWRLIGKPMQRMDVAAKSTGAQLYGIDLTLPGMVHAIPKLSPRRSALRRYDATEALQMRGVSQVVEITNGVAVIADNTWRGFRAVDALHCEWEEAPYPAEQADHWRAVEDAFVEDHLDRLWRDDGDVDAAIGAEAVQAEYRAGYAAHQPLEPINAIVLVEEGGATVWTGHHMPRFVQQEVAKITGHEPEQVVFFNQMSGGSFGHRLEFENVTRAAEVANQMRGTPVKMTFSREEDFRQDFPRQIGMARARGMVAEGQIQAVAVDVATTSASRSQLGRIGMPATGPDTQIAAGLWNAPYALPNMRVRGYAVPELAPTSSWRSVGAVTAGFFGESFIDELIHAAGADPLAERLRMANDPRATAVLEAVGDMSGWGRSLKAGQGLGVALVESFGCMTAEVIEVEDTPAGIAIRKAWVAAEIGTLLDPVNFENQVQGGVVWGLGHAMNCEITYADGRAEQENYHAHEGMRLWQCPEIEVRAVEMGGQIRGIGEPPVPPAAPALANAIFAATGTRLRHMPFFHQIRFA